MARTSTASTSVDFEKPGKQIGFVNIPHSPHEDAWGATRIPIAVIRNGTGPTVILQAGNHGDEYEGPIALGELIRELDPGMVSGRIIFLPAVNVPAVLAGRRTSPVDGLNLNRTFPGDPHGPEGLYFDDTRFVSRLELRLGGRGLLLLGSALEIVRAHVQLLRLERDLGKARLGARPEDAEMDGERAGHRTDRPPR